MSDRIQEIRARCDEIGIALCEGHGDSAYNFLRYALKFSGVDTRLVEFFARSYDNELYLLDQLAASERREQAAVRDLMMIEYRPLSWWQKLRLNLPWYLQTFAKSIRKCSICKKHGVYENEKGEWLCWACWTEKTGLPF